MYIEQLPCCIILEIDREEYQFDDYIDGTAKDIEGAIGNVRLLCPYRAWQYWHHREYDI